MRKTLIRCENEFQFADVKPLLVPFLRLEKLVEDAGDCVCIRREFNLLFRLDAFQMTNRASTVKLIH